LIQPFIQIINLNPTNSKSFKDRKKKILEINVVYDLLNNRYNEIRESLIKNEKGMVRKKVVKHCNDK
jgi:hypothetical protein